MLITEVELKSIIRRIILEGVESRIESIAEFREILQDNMSVKIDLTSQKPKIRKAIEGISDEHPLEAGDTWLEYDTQQNQSLFPNLKIGIKVKPGPDENIEDLNDYAAERAGPVVSKFLKRVATWLNRRVIKSFSRQFEEDPVTFLKDLNSFLLDFERIEFVAGKLTFEGDLRMNPTYVNVSRGHSKDVTKVRGVSVSKITTDIKLVSEVFHEFLHHYEVFFMTEEIGKVAKKQVEKEYWSGRHEDKKTEGDEFLGLKIYVDEDQTMRVLKHLLTPAEYNELFFVWEDHTSWPGDNFELNAYYDYSIKEREEIDSIYDYIENFKDSNLQHMYGDYSHNDPRGSSLLHLPLSIRTIYELADRSVAASRGNRGNYQKWFEKLLKLEWPSSYYRQNPEVARAIAPLIWMPDWNAKALASYYEIASAASSEIKDTAKV